MKTVFLQLLLVIIMVANPATAASETQCNFPAIFNFGDSNSDTGGLRAIYAQVPRPPYGNTFFHSPAGRFSDGRVLIDFIAKAFELPYLSAYLDSVGSNFSNGANFATAGSTIRPQNTTRTQSGFSPVSLDVQFAEFSDFKTRSEIVRKGGGVFENLLPKKEYFSQALYTFDIGQNDLVASYKLNFTTKQIKEYIIPDLLAQFSSVIRSVYGEGGRSFWIHNTGPLGCLPYILVPWNISEAQMDKFGCAIEFNEVAQYFNRKLKEAAVQLRKELPEATIVYVDLYKVKHDLYTNSQKYGFEKGMITCCGTGGNYYNFNDNAWCGATEMVNGTEVVIADSCEDPSVRIIWDGAHTTETANIWVFQQIANGSFSDPPISLNMACHPNDFIRHHTSNPFLLTQSIPSLRWLKSRLKESK